MGSFDYISVIALACYVFLFLIFISARKDHIVNSYLQVIAASIIWTGGSYFMRVQLWPSYTLWYHVSLGGLLYLAYALFVFVNAFSGQNRRGFRVLWLALLAATFAVNAATGVFLAPPEQREVRGEMAFVYHMTWTVGVLFLVAGAVMVHMVYIIITNFRRSPSFRKQIEPTLLGILLMFAGNLALLIPALEGFPIDILCCLVNAGLMFYALIRRRLFRLKMLAGEAVSFGAALIVAVALFYAFSARVLAILRTALPHMSDTYLTFALGTGFLIVSVVFIYLWKKVVSVIFIKEERMRQDCLQHFSLSASKSLRLKDIFEETVKAIQMATDAEAVYICMPEKPGGAFRTVHTDKPLTDRALTVQPDSPILTQLMETEAGVFVQEFRYTVAYKGLWSEEKKILEDLNIVYMQPLLEQDELVGVIFLSVADKRNSFNADDIAYLSALSSVAAIAVKNSMLYERAYTEAVTDELTGLYNRKYFTAQMNEQFEACSGSSIALVLINVDDFKLYNQLYGMAEGDRALQRIARIIRASVGDNGIVARYSGKEFAVLLPHYDVLAARKLTESISHQIYEMNADSGEYAIKRLTVSAGISAYPYGATTPKALFENVDLSVYYAKRSGKNTIRVFDTTVNGVEKLEDDGTTPKKIYQEYESTVFALTAAIDAKDRYTFHHSNNVAYYATSLGEALGMNDDTIEILRQAALLHDVGKIGIPESILNKPGRLTPEEYEVIKGHVNASISIIKHLPSLDYVIPAVLGHHERYDGHGYPRGLEGENIPQTARVLCVADSFDAMVSKRCYKDSMPLSRAIEILEEEAGKQFDPEMSRIFIGLLKGGKVKVAAEEIRTE